MHVVVLPLSSIVSAWLPFSNFRECLKLSDFSVDDDVVLFDTNTGFCPCGVNSTKFLLFDESGLTLCGQVLIASSKVSSYRPFIRVNPALHIFCVSVWLSASCLTLGQFKLSKLWKRITMHSPLVQFHPLLSGASR